MKISCIILSKLHLFLQNLENDIPDWFTEKYGTEADYSEKKSYTKIKGTNKYRKAQKKKERIKRRAEISRVYALLDEMAAVGF